METESPTTIEGLPGSLPFTAGGVLFFLALIIYLRIRSVLHPEAVGVTVSDDSLLRSLLIGVVVLLLIMLLVTPLLHQLSHALVCVLKGGSITIQSHKFYPRVRPQQPVARTTARWFFSAPLILSFIALLVLVIKPLSLYAAIIGAFNLALSINDIWKLLGLNRVPEFAQVRILTKHCEVVSA